mmetsp:Transcript_10214/g.12607  ORF Transcript_10214/g.12607 Transcript_10214/m.12607 type:complete len:181 (-) Transcript_10214:69-611(-)|eukprot:CAMPEP_0206201634 /NCGR_PEP_ID=MMETSP0166-20121206/11677_1 /ASSEMBLY_ACC=CAM_ASM_000260 /TAXON_ID=95228 /ORGANISM="Vannella robusta, Strain DIVA3 518/3/11/1/6" /LENGTH=180 /DNA_ID=CAMNT_0053620371 /DNA_START=38 /DNA_END=580 /DNA_ORIENTATION=-
MQVDNSMDVKEKLDVFRVLYDEKQDKNVNIASVLQKRQQQGKEPGAKKQRVASELVVRGDKQKARLARKQRQRKQTEAYTKQIERIHKFYTSEISALQHAWDTERETLEDKVQDLNQQILELQTTNQSLKNTLESTENQLENYALLYKESTKEMESNRESEQKKKAVLSRLRMEMAMERK